MTDIELSEQLLAQIQGDGLVLCDDSAALARLEELARRIQAALPGNVLDGLDVLFVFREADQQEPLRGCDGWIWWFHGFGRIRHVIGVSTETLEGDEDYALLVLLHEIAHLLSGQGHNAAFSGCLDKLILEYNRRSGSHIVNDYAGVMLPGQNIRADAAGAKVPRIGQKRRGWPLGKL